MRKPAVFIVFAALAVVAIGAGVSMHFALASAGLAWLGWSADILVCGLVILAGLGCFHPNAPIFGRVIDGRRIEAGVMALTFDDGPSPDTTPRILDTLREMGASATFFVLGKHVQRHPELIERMTREGHEVASHGWTHGLLVFASPTRIRRELTDTARLLALHAVPSPMLFRAPHGFRGPLLASVAGRLGYRMVGWSAGVYDTALPGANVIAERSRRAMHRGAILLLHDGDGNGDEDRSQTADALPAILRDMHDKGLRPVTVSELAALQPDAVRRWGLGVWIAGIGVAIIGLLIYRADLSSIRSNLAVFAGLNLGLVGAAILANLVSIALKATVWKASLDSIPSHPPVRFAQVCSAVFIGFLMNSVLVARAGELGRAIVLRRRIWRDSGERIPIGTIAGTVVSEHLVLGVSLVVLLAAMGLTVSSLPQWVINGVIGMLAFIVLLLLGMVVIEVFGRWRRDRVQTQPVSHPSPRRPRWIARHLGGIIDQLHQGQRILSDPPRAALAIGAGFASWMANLLAIWLTALAFGLHDAFAAAVIVLAVSNLVGVVQLVPSNVGVFQVAIALALSESYGIDRTVGLSFGIGLQVIEVGLGAGLGLVFLALEGLSLRDVRKDMKGAAARFGADSADPTSGLA